MQQNEPEQSIYGAAVTCSELFDIYLKSPNITEEHHDIAEELRGRFNLWAAYVGAFASPKASLDARLADLSDVKGMVLDLLDMVERNLTHEITPSNLKEPPDSILAELNCDDTPLFLGLNAVDTALNRLHSLAVAVRRSASRRSYRQHVVANPSIVKSEGLCYLQFVKHRFPHANDNLVEQVGTSIYIRGQSMYYQQRHNRKIAENRKPVEPEPGMAQRTKQELQSRPAMDQLLTSEMPKAPISETNVSKIDKSELMRRITRPKRSLSQASTGSSVVEGQDEKYSYPKKPNAARSNFGACPLCFEPINTATMTEKKWRNHVDLDMEPYVCIPERCRNSLQFFATSLEWRKHMQSMHTLEWAWNVHTSLWSCDIDHERVPKELDEKEFNDKDGLRQHLSNAHGEKLSRAQIIARTRSGRTFQTREAFTCPFCDCQPDEVVSHISEKPYDLLSTHIARHLKSLAFISLSYLDFVEEYSDSSGSKNLGTRAGEAARSTSAAQFDDIPPTLVIENVRYVESQSFLEPEELDIPVIWPTGLVPEFSGPDRTLERLAGATKEGPRKALHFEKEFLDFVNHPMHTLRGYNGLGEVVPFIQHSALSGYLAENGIGPELRKLSKFSSPGDLLGYETVFSILIYMGRPEFLQFFMQHGLGDLTLPVTDLDLPNLDPEALEVVEEFCENQWQFCPVLFPTGAPKVIRKLCPREILPIQNIDVLRVASSSDNITIVCKVEYHEGYHDPSNDGTIVFREYRDSNDNTPLSSSGWPGRILSLLKSNMPIPITKFTSSSEKKDNFSVILEYGNGGMLPDSGGPVAIGDDDITQKPHGKSPSASLGPKKNEPENVVWETSTSGNINPLSGIPSSSKVMIHNKGSTRPIVSKQASQSESVTLSFLFKVNELRYEYYRKDNYWHSVPPTRPEQYTNELESVVMRYKNGKVSKCSDYVWSRGNLQDLEHTEGMLCSLNTESNASFTPFKYSTCAVFACNPLLPIMICPDDPYVNDTTCKWQLLQIHHPLAYPGLSQVAHEDSIMPQGPGLRRYIASSQPRWMPSLVPDTYRWPFFRGAPPPPSTGLGGELAIILGLMALTAEHDFSDRNNNTNILFLGDGKRQGCWRDGRWSSAGLPKGHPLSSDDLPVGFLVTVFLDPENPQGSTKEMLRWFEWDQPIVRE